MDQGHRLGSAPREAGIWHAAAFEKRATGAKGMVDRLTTLARTPDRFTFLPEGRDAEGEFAGAHGLV